MGVIRIETRGSFGNRVKEFQAINHGHADAVAQALEWLSGELLPQSTALDHTLHEAGNIPRFGFNRKES